MYDTKRSTTNLVDNAVYADVTEANCISWLHAEMGEEQVQSLLDSVAANIELQKNPVDGHGTPWSE